MIKYLSFAFKISKVICILYIPEDMSKKTNMCTIATVNLYILLAEHSRQDWTSFVLNRTNNFL